MILIADFIKKLGIEERLDSYLPKAGSNKGYEPSQKILSFLSSIYYFYYSLLSFFIFLLTSLKSISLGLFS